MNLSVIWCSSGACVSVFNSFTIWVKEIVPRSAVYTSEKKDSVTLLRIWNWGEKVKRHLTKIRNISSFLGPKKLLLNAVETVSKILIKNCWDRSHCITYAAYVCLLLRYMYRYILSTLCNQADKSYKNYFIE